LQGEVDRALDLLRGISKRAESSSVAYGHVVGTDRTIARLTRRLRLFEPLMRESLDRSELPETISSCLPSGPWASGRGALLWSSHRTRSRREGRSRTRVLARSPSSWIRR
jgi:hypothetical protein